MNDVQQGLSAIARLKVNKRPGKTILFPGTDRPMGLQTATEYDIDQARIDAWAHLSKHGIDPDKVRGSAMFQREVMNFVLLRCTYIPEGNDAPGAEFRVPFAADIDDLKKNMTSDEREVILRELADFTSETDPDVDTVEGQAEASLLLKEIEKKAKSKAALVASLNDTPPDVLRRCIVIMAPQWSSSLEDKS